MSRPSFVVLLVAMMMLACGPAPETPKASKVPQEPPFEPTMVKSTDPVDKWHVSFAENELDHSRKTHLDNGELFVRCLPKFEGYIAPALPQLGHRLQSDTARMQLVRFRINDGPVKSEYWTVSDDFEALFIPPDTLRRVLNATRLTVEYQPEYVEKETTTIDLSGLKDAAESAGCKTAMPHKAEDELHQLEFGGEPIKEIGSQSPHPK
jgi:hypothetical protein